MAQVLAGIQHGAWCSLYCYCKGSIWSEICLPLSIELHLCFYTQVLHATLVFLLCCLCCCFFLSLLAFSHLPPFSFLYPLCSAVQIVSLPYLTLSLPFHHTVSPLNCHGKVLLSLPPHSWLSISQGKYLLTANISNSIEKQYFLSVSCSFFILTEGTAGKPILTS